MIAAAMNLSHDSSNVLFEDAFRPTLTNMSFESSSKMAKKTFKNHHFQIVG